MRLKKESIIYNPFKAEKIGIFKMVRKIELLRESCGSDDRGEVIKFRRYP